MSKIDAINLLPTASSLKASQRRLAEKLRKFATVAVILLVIIVGGVFGYQFWLRSKKNQLLNEKKGLNQSISQFSPQLELQQKLRFRLKVVSDLMASRLESSQEITDVENVIPSDGFVDNISFKGKTTQIKGIMPSLFQIKELEDEVTRLRRENIYQKLSLGSLHKAPEGWPFTLEITK